MLWYFLGIIYLSILTYQDYAKKMMVNDRYNYLMIGATAMLYDTYKHNWYYLFLIVGLAVFLSWAVVAVKSFAVADAKTLLWSFIGFAIIDLRYLLVYLVSFLAVYCLQRFLWFLMQKIIKEKIMRLPGYPIFLISFCLALGLNWLLF